MNQVLDRHILAVAHDYHENLNGKHCSGHGLLKELDADGPSSGLPERKLRQRILSLGDQRFLEFYGHSDPHKMRANVSAEQGLFMYRITALGEQELAKPPEQFGQQAGAGATFNFGGVTAHNVAAGTNVQQMNTINVTVGQLLDSLQQGVAEAPIPEEKKEQAKDLVSQLKDVLGSAASLTTVLKFMGVG